MHHFFGLFEHSSSTSQLLVFAALLVACWNIEGLAGLAVNYSKWNHALLNGKFILIGALPQFTMGLLFARTIQWTFLHHFGVIYWLPHSSPIIYFLVAFVFLDFGEYVYHLIMHKIRLLWLFHAVHHSDANVDVSTTLREHPIENLIRNSFTILWILLSGALFWMVFFRQIIQMTSNMLVHMNYSLPPKWDAVLGMVFITPNIHQVHHHYQRPFTDSNYGDVLSIWDHIFGTFERLAHEQIVFGVDTHMDQKVHSRFISLISMPFIRTGYKKAK